MCNHLKTANWWPTLLRKLFCTFRLFCFHNEDHSDCMERATRNSGRGLETDSSCSCDPHPATMKLKWQTDSLWLSASIPAVACYLTLPKTNQKKSWTFLPAGEAKMKQILGKIEELWFQTKPASYKATVVATVTFCSASSMPRNINAPWKYRDKALGGEKGKAWNNFLFVC